MKVRQLPPEIISKIAAGEVIERPASVIKELVENAFDAETTGIEINLQQAGKTLIHVKDTGFGIAHEDIETIFLRHSTSKITSIKDLWDIHSLGFRGEALYSICAIADVILRSKTGDQETGWEIHMRGGEKLDIRPMTMPTGTEVEIKELFFNTPARRKFLKSNVAELNQILNIVIPYALLYPNCRFLLSQQDKTSLDLNPTENLLSRIAETLNLEEQHLVESSQNFPDQSISIRMVLGDINIVRSRRDMQFIFINNRPVQSKTISFHMNDIYRLILPPGHYPFFALYIDIPANEVDVNIHPTKREVKIRDEQTLSSLLRRMCEHTLMTGGQTKQAGEISAKPNEPSIVKRALAEVNAPSMTFDNVAPPDAYESSTIRKASQAPTEQYNFPQTADFGALGETLLEKKQDGLQNKLSRARPIGSLINKFLLFEVGQSLLIIDQHAAQERVTFELLVQQMEKGRVEIQHLLSPYLIKLSPQDIVMWEEAKERLEETGLSSTLFDEETIAVHTYPVLLKDPVKAVQDILAGGDAARCDHETIARRACRASIMAGDPLHQQQAEYIRDQLMRCRDPFTCPHGRPTVVEMTENFLDKQFLRT